MRITPEWNAVRVLLLVPLLALAFGACAPAEDESHETGSSEAASRTDEPGADKPDTASLDLEETVAVFILPAPSEIAAAVESEAGFDIGRVADEPLPAYEELPTWRQAVALGQVVADLLITASEAPTPRIVAYLDNVETGLRSLGIAEDQLVELETLRSEVAAGAIGRDALIARFDRIRVELLQRGKAQLGDRTMALVAAGGWARAVNLVSSHIQKTDRIPERADALKLRLVVTSLIERIGPGEDVRPVVESLEAILPLTAARPSPPSRDELATLIAETDEILALTRAS